MKTYTFADKDAPVSEHMKGLVKALRVWRSDIARREQNAPNQQQRARERATRQAYDQIIAIIEDSSSIEAEPHPAMVSDHAFQPALVSGEDMCTYSWRVESERTSCQRPEREHDQRRERQRLAVAGGG